MPNPDHDILTTRTFGAWLKRRRRLLDLTQQELGQRAGCSGATIKKIESDDLKPSKQLAELMAAALVVPDTQRGAFVAFARTGQTSEQFTQLGAMPTAVTPEPAETSRHNNLPAQLNDLLGRERESVAATRLLGRHNVRLLTLVGPPGTGKTRLACNVAAQAQSGFAHGVCAVWLARLTDAETVPAAILRELGVAMRHDTNPVADLHAYLKNKQVLLLLDNFEHLLDAAPAITTLLQAAPDVKVMVTSREPLSVTGEREFPVPPLELPDVNHLPTLDQLAAVPSIALFIERAQAVRPDFVLQADNASDVARICGWLEGLPLAIEMAAARTKWTSPKVLLQQLSGKLSVLTDQRRDLSPRHQTMWAAIDWSYSLLPPPERALLRRMSILPEGGDLPAIEGTCEDDDMPSHIGGARVLQLLTQLVNKSMVITLEWSDRPLFRLLEPVRQFACEKLVEAGEHDHTYLRLLALIARNRESVLMQISGSNYAGYADLVSDFFSVMDTIHVALDWAFEFRTDEALVLAARIIAASGRFWITLGYFQDAWRYASQALARSAPLLEVALRARLLQCAAEAAFYRHDFALSRTLASEAIASARTCEDPRTLAASLWVLGVVAHWVGDIPNARESLEESIAHSRAAGDLEQLTRSLCSKGDLLELSRDYDVALSVFQECVAMATQRGDERNVALALRGLGDTLRGQQRLEEADAVYTRSSEVARKLGDRVGLGITLVNRAILADLRGDPLAVRELATEAQAIVIEIGSRHELPYIHRLLGYAALHTGDLIEADRRFKASLVSNRDEGNRTGIVASVLACAALALHQDQFNHAAQLFGATTALIQEGATLLMSDAKVLYEVALALQLHQHDSDLATAQIAGAALSLDAAVERALTADADGSQF